MEIREPDFEEFVLNADRPVLVDFWASWCPPCKMMQPVVDKLGQKVADWADVYCVNIDRSPLAGQFQVSGVPTFMAFADGQVVDRRTGALTEGQLLGLLKQAKEAMTEEPPAADPATPSDRSFITVVSGLPRSGTSLMMRMLEAGGVPALTDELRSADEDNPNGYFEFEDVKSVESDATWIDAARGRSVKMVYSLLRHLPPDYEYRIVFMRRHVDEILQSQKKMLDRNGIVTDVPDEQLRTLFDRELRQFYAWLPAQTHLKLVNVSYNELMSDPAAAVHQINRHLGLSLNTQAMIQMVDPKLYRHRAA